MLPNTVLYNQYWYSAGRSPWSSRWEKLIKSREGDCWLTQSGDKLDGCHPKMLPHPGSYLRWLLGWSHCISRLYKKATIANNSAGMHIMLKAVHAGSLLGQQESYKSTSPRISTVRSPRKNWQNSWMVKNCTRHGSENHGKIISKMPS